MNLQDSYRSLLKLKIPTIIGLVFLVFALMAGTFFFSRGTGVFAPRATPQTTPKSIRITNVTDNSFTVSFLTDESTGSFVKYGTEEGNLDTEAKDDRFNLYGEESFTAHHISVLGLQPATKYYFVIGTGNGALFDQNGSSFTVTTAQRTGAPSSAKTIYGSVTTESGSPAEGSIVYVKIPGAGDMSSLVKKSNSWAVPLSNARTLDGTSYVELSDDDSLVIAVQGPKQSQQMEYEVSVANAQPVPELQFGTGPAPVAAAPDTTSTGDIPSAATSPAASPQPTLAGTASGSATLNENPVSGTLISPPAATESGKLGSALTEQGGIQSENQIDTETTIDLTKTVKQEVKTTKPEFVGKAAPNVQITIEVNSETQIVQTVTADQSGNFNLDLEELSQDLEPGEHTVRYSYTEPTTGELISQLISFTVYAAEDETAFGTDNPYPTATVAAASPTQAPTTAPTPTTAATTSATVAPTATSTPTPAATDATDSGRVSMPSTSSGVPVSGSVDVTLALIIGGLFFILAGGWSYWISLELAKKE